MRKVLVCIVAIGILVTALSLFQKPVAPLQKSSDNPSPTISRSPTLVSESLDIVQNEKKFRITWLPVRDLSTLTLIPNFTHKRIARSLIDTKECTHVINGGFYTTDYQPTGLFVAQGKTLRTTNPNALLNGYFVIEPDNTASIQYAPPESSVRIALQTGPILMKGGSPVKLAIRDDEPDRRVGLGVTKNGSVIFFVTYDPENTWSGPRLADMPNMVSKILSQLSLTDAINLDGGSASAFIRGDFSLQELVSVGSFFCVQ